MLVLDTCGTRAGNSEAGVVAIFGVGLVGQSIASRVCTMTDAASVTLPFSWSSAERRKGELADIKACLVRRSQVSEKVRRRISVVWSAGLAGFASSKNALDLELESFRGVVDLCREVLDESSPQELDLHVLSSAGGLFEGQRGVGLSSSPSPLRPYAAAKLEQEEIAYTLPQECTVSVYRPSSIYGYRKGGRSGLIITLINNGFRRRMTKVFGHLDTMRDYVHVSDIGRFIGDKVLNPPALRDQYLLASGKPTTMRQIIRHVEEVVSRKLYLEFDPDPDNALHNTYGTAALRHFANALPLQEGIARCAREWFSGELT